ncbi:hypothetical protein BDZ97DRAFT_1914577 [Flammula alnicola]|nr:hypothetical protein BDZ97DRAFT_1914577 [Flammula alnicola]
MAAIYLHNAIYAGNPSELRDTLEHSRNLSTISSATLLTSTTLHSQPTEPLLHTPTTGAAAESYFDQISRQPRNPDGTPARLHWDDPLVLNIDPHAVGEKNRWRRKSGGLSPRWKKVKLILEIVIGAWAIYNTVRYFMAFAIFGRNSHAGKSFSFALGTSTGIAFFLAFCTQGLFVVMHKLRVQAQTFQILTRICSILHYLSSICILGPAIVNFVVVFLWKNSADSPYNLQNRCHVDIDVVWSVTHNLCTNKSAPWSIWLTLCSVRLALTLVFLLVYHTISFLQPELPRRPLHDRLQSESYPSAPSTPGRRPSLASMLPQTPNDHLHPHHQISDSTLRDSYRPPSRLARPRSRSSGMSGETACAEPISLGRSALPESENECDDRFRSYLAQIAQETEAAVEFARLDQVPFPEIIRKDPPSPPSPPGLPPSYSRNDARYENDDGDEDYDDRFYGHNDNNIFDLPPIPPVLGYNEFGMPYPPDQNVRMLNGYIRRMPTIESMGSGEVTNSIGASTRPGGSVYTSSRPPTRNTLLSFSSSADYEMTGSAPPSRSNSLSARVELLAGLAPASVNSHGTSEHGELLGRDIAVRRVSSPTSFLEHLGAGGSADTYSSGGSRGTTTTSYHTATMGSSHDSYPPVSVSSTQPKGSDHEHEHAT